MNLGGVLTSTNLNTPISVNTYIAGTGVSFTLPAITAGMDGWLAMFEDPYTGGSGIGSWAINAVTLNPSGGAVVESPTSGGSFGASAVLNADLGGAIQYRCYYPENIWKKV